MSKETNRRVLLSAQRITYRALYAEILTPVSIQVAQGECWIVAGPNGSGKSILAEILAGVRTPYSGLIEWPGMPNGPGREAALVSFERQERIMARERRDDLSAIMQGRLDPGHTVRELIDGADDAVDLALADRLAARFGIGHIMDRGLRFLSTGEFRKSLLAAAVARSPQLLILDEPYDGLDSGSRGELARLVEELHDSSRALVIVLNRHRDIPRTATHVLDLDRGTPRFAGPIADWPLNAPANGTGERAPGTRAPDRSAPGPAPIDDDTPLIEMRDVHLAYGRTPVLQNLTWTVRRHDRWMIHGPNGSGKSSILSLITGENPKAYGQAITLFGRRKGSGESVWEIKRRVGVVSGDLQLRYPTRVRVIDAVLSGFYDSVGLFDEPSGYEVERAHGWIDRIGLAGRERARMRELSFGQRRMVLIARAMVKRPELLIADEPCQGLDDAHAEQVLALLDGIGADAETCLLYVTHNADEELSCLTHTLRLEPGPEGSRAVATP